MIDKFPVERPCGVFHYSVRTGLFQPLVLHKVNPSLPYDPRHARYRDLRKERITWCKDNLPCRHKTRWTNYLREASYGYSEEAELAFGFVNPTDAAAFALVWHRPKRIAL